MIYYMYGRVKGINGIGWIHCSFVTMQRNEIKWGGLFVVEPTLRAVRRTGLDVAQDGMRGSMTSLGLPLSVKHRHHRPISPNNERILLGAARTLRGASYSGKKTLPKRMIPTDVTGCERLIAALGANRVFPPFNLRLLEWRGY